MKTGPAPICKKFAGTAGRRVAGGRGHAPNANRLRLTPSPRGDRRRDPSPEPEETPLRHRRILPLTLAVTAAALAAGAARADLPECTAGHADIGLGYEGPGELFLHYHFEGSTVDGITLADEEFEPEDAYTRVSDATGRNFDAVPSGFEFTGMTPDGNPDTSDFWVLPQSNTSGVPFLGFATEELFASDWIGDLSFNLTGMRFTPFGTGVAGQGEFSLWQTSGLGGPTPFMSTVDGIDADDAISLATGRHDHFNLGFSEEGQYELDFLASGTHATDGFVSDFGTFKFAVGSGTPGFQTAAVPEPGTMVLIGLAACGVAGGASRRRRKREPTTV